MFHNLREGGIVRQLAPGITARVFPGVHAMLSVVTLEPHSVSPVHSHPNEQWGVCLEGEWIRIQDGEAHAPLLVRMRSEEHTSELQSRFDLVCRLLLEKKKIILFAYSWSSGTERYCLLIY